MAVQCGRRLACAPEPTGPRPPPTFDRASASQEPQFDTCRQPVSTVRACRAQHLKLPPFLQSCGYQGPRQARVTASMYAEQHCPCCASSVNVELCFPGRAKLRVNGVRNVHVEHNI
jgi:hypothetical protein